MSTPITSLQSALKNLPENAHEASISDTFSTVLLQALGFESGEIVPQYETGSGRKVDKAARKTIGADIFSHTKSSPYLILELKAKGINLAEGRSQYSEAVSQLKEYLLSPNCKSVQWGIITNSCHIQLFRKHGKVIFPATQCLVLNFNNIDKIVGSIRKKIENPNKALTVTIYNNKGGVGKTTTTINLAGILTLASKKVLVIDFDLNQQDLTKNLSISRSEGFLVKALTDKNIDILSAVHPYSFPTKKKTLTFDVIPADLELANNSDTDNILSKVMQQYTLYKKLELARKEYDYILIDASPNWRFITQLAIYAADVIFMPTKHKDISSLENAAVAIQRFIPEIQSNKGDGSPVALPVFFNGEKITISQLEIAQKEINNIIETFRRKKFDLLSYFYPKFTRTEKNLRIHTVPSYANIHNAAFLHVPAVYRDSYALEFYKSLAKEYFIQ